MIFWATIAQYTHYPHYALFSCLLVARAGANSWETATTGEALLARKILCRHAVWKIMIIFAVQMALCGAPKAILYDQQTAN